MSGFAAISNGGKGRASSRSRAEAAAHRRACAWVARRRQERRTAVQTVTTRLARERLEAKP